MLMNNFLTKDPKSGPVWKSESYRGWMQMKKICIICRSPLCYEKIGYTSHHHRHSGGKKPRDQLLVPICLKCHNEFHHNEAKFNKKHKMTEITWLRYCSGFLADYLDSMNINPYWVAINALQQVIMEEECGKK